jgi:hypothetical protein
LVKKKDSPKLVTFYRQRCACKLYDQSNYVTYIPDWGLHREIIFFITLKNKVCHLWWLEDSTSHQWWRSWAANGLRCVIKTILSLSPWGPQNGFQLFLILFLAVFDTILSSLSMNLSYMERSNYTILVCLWGKYLYDGLEDWLIKNTKVSVCWVYMLYVCMYVCMHAQTRNSIYVCMHQLTCIEPCVYMCVLGASMHMYMCGIVCVLHDVIYYIYICMYICIYICVCVCVCVYMCLQCTNWTTLIAYFGMWYICTYMYVSICICICTYSHVYVPYTNSRGKTFFISWLEKFKFKLTWKIQIGYFLSNNIFCVVHSVGGSCNVVTNNGGSCVVKFAHNDYIHIYI